MFGDPKAVRRIIAPCHIALRPVPDRATTPSGPSPPYSSLMMLQQSLNASSMKSRASSHVARFHLLEPLLPVEEQRPLQAVVVVDLLNHVDAAQAETTLVVGEVRVALDPLKLAVLDVGQDATAVVASRPGPDGSAGNFITIFVPSPVTLVQVVIVFVDDEISPLSLSSRTGTEQKLFTVEPLSTPKSPDLLWPLYAKHMSSQQHATQGVLLNCPTENQHKSARDLEIYLAKKNTWRLRSRSFRCSAGCLRRTCRRTGSFGCASRRTGDRSLAHALYIS